MGQQAGVGPAAGRPVVTITYCTKCHFLPRAVWLAQELLHTFTDSLGGVMLTAGSGGIFEVAVDGEVLFSTKTLGHFPETRELREAVGAKLEGGWTSRHA